MSWFSGAVTTSAAEAAEDAAAAAGDAAAAAEVAAAAACEGAVGAADQADHGLSRGASCWGGPTSVTLSTSSSARATERTGMVTEVLGSST